MPVSSRRECGHFLGHRTATHPKPSKLDHKRQRAKLLFCKHNKPSKLRVASS